MLWIFHKWLLIHLKAKDLENGCKLVDLDEYEVPENSYDFIVMTNFLDRKYYC